MKLFLGTVLAASVVATGAMAFEITGGKATVNVTGVGDDFSYSQYEFKGDVAMGLGSGLGLQAGVSVGDYTTINPYRIGELHLTYALSPSVTVGAFYGREVYHASFNAAYYGIEGKLVSGALGLEGAIFSEKGVAGTSYKHNAVMVDASFGLTDKIGLIGGVHVLDNPSNPGNNEYAYVGGTYAMAPALNVSASVGRMIAVNDYTETMVTVGLSYAFGAGVFSQHGFNSVLPGE